MTRFLTLVESAERLDITLPELKRRLLAHGVSLVLGDTGPMIAEVHVTAMGQRRSRSMLGLGRYSMRGFSGQ